MPHLQRPNSMTSVVLLLCTARDLYQTITPLTDRALNADQWAKLDPAIPGCFLNRLLKETGDVAAALSDQVQKTTAMNRLADRTSMYISHFYQALDNAITRGDLPSGAAARVYYKRDASGGPLPDLSTHAAIEVAADQLVKGENQRLAAEGAGAVPITLPSVAQVGEQWDAFHDARIASTNAVIKTDHEREDASGLYAEALELANDIIDTVEYFYRKDADPASRRAKCARWGLTYLYGDGEAPVPPHAPTPPPA